MKIKIFRAVSKSLLHPWFRLRRGLTLGVRGLVRDSEGNVLLVKHTYVPGWMFPGGGVEKGETTVQALIRELREETGVICTGKPRLFGFYGNDASFTGDHVAFYIVDEWRAQSPQWKANMEIRAAEFFARDDLPPETSAGTKRRLDEVFKNTQVDDIW